MSRFIADCLVAGGIADEPERGTAETVRCWPMPKTSGAPVEYMRAKVCGKFCDKRGERVVAGNCRVHHA